MDYSEYVKKQSKVALPARIDILKSVCEMKKVLDKANPAKTETAFFERMQLKLESYKQIEGILSSLRR